jgi:hypothetical protein
LKELLQEILDFCLSGVFPNITVALPIFVSFPAPVSLGERIFSVLKHVKLCEIFSGNQPRQCSIENQRFGDNSVFVIRV